MENYYKKDLQRYYPKAGQYEKSFLFWFRLAQSTNNKLVRLFAMVVFNRIKSHHGIEVCYISSIGPGLYIGHPYNITINPQAVIGKNCNIHKGVTIGRENRGVRKGTPVIGDEVWIGVNATVVGKITIGDDVMIAPNSFVNCDVPSHSIVFGNPCIIKHRDNATENYINQRI